MLAYLRGLNFESNEELGGNSNLWTGTNWLLCENFATPITTNCYLTIMLVRQQQIITKKKWPR